MLSTLFEEGKGLADASAYAQEREGTADYRVGLIVARVRKTSVLLEHVVAYASCPVPEGGEGTRSRARQLRSFGEALDTAKRGCLPSDFEESCALILRLIEEGTPSEWIRRMRAD